MSDFKDKNIIEYLMTTKPSWGTTEPFFDWFCNDASLRKKVVKLDKKLREVVAANFEGRLFDPTKTYVIYKNNCPMTGHLYDDFRICDQETQDVLFTITPRSGYTAADDYPYGQSSVWDNRTTGHDVVRGKWKDVLQYFRTGIPTYVEQEVDGAI